ncbi:nucleotide pyrophosphohydrolase [Knoellia sp. Soil729]|uniref:nucleotide pyrophosphohydrolase n=1 Tax=Knoellia sp. Soil729 TaxID=1736394 RepID=UPI0006F34479|nr:nucleotide pyrophosphohydrolase [Knoellia sp. Soil729]KRE42767.1 nucleotide pyrophosphohydrolase [Knoellia sp. Soil729]
METTGWTDRIRSFAEEREWQQFHTPKNLVMALSVEASELVEIFQWLTAEESATIMSTERGQAVRDEVADVMTYLLRFADVLDIDLDAAMAAKIEASAQRYTVEHSKGSAAKR